MRVAAEPRAKPPGVDRADLASRTLLRLKRGHRANPDVLLVRTDAGLVVVKDFAARPATVRWFIARASLRREARALNRLAETGFAPRALGWLDPLALVIEHRAGTKVSRRRPWPFSPRYIAELWDALHEMHELGVVHLDLGHRSNVRCDADGRPLLIDFATALTLERNRLPERLLRAAVRFVDERAVRKWERWLREAAVAASVETGRRTPQLRGENGANGSTGGAAAGGRVASRPM